ncbi:MAG TPA: thiamine pyrophosphate-dependent enzyme [Clostridia bacterium]|nr:thiamine pyrophosphate-dependent enzyme [Clostridia bacterium]
MPTPKKALRTRRKPELRSTPDTPSAVTPQNIVPLGRELLERLYGAMLKCRLVEERTRRAFPHAATAHKNWLGQEAVYVGSTLQLTDNDTLAPSEHDSFAQIIKGTPLRFIFAQRFAAEDSRSLAAHCGYAPRNVITPSSKDGANIHIAAGVALTSKLQKSAGVVVALCGPITHSGAWQDALRFAGALKLPMLFVVESRLAASTRQAGQPASKQLAAEAAAYGVARISVDADDVIAIYRVAHEAIHRARIGRGPSLIECVSAPVRNSGRDPLAHLERYMRRYNVWSDQWRDDIIRTYTAEINAAIKVARKSPFLEPEQALSL